MTSSPKLILTESSIKLNAAPRDKVEAIKAVGEILVAAGAVSPDFIDSLQRREAVSNTYLGEGIAIPHGMVEDKSLIKEDAIAVLQVPNGVEWNGGERATLIVGIAAKGDTHITILRRLTRLMQNKELLAQLQTTTDPQLILAALLEDQVNTQAHVTTEAVTDLAEQFEWTVDYPSGLHARPATAWSDAAKAWVNQGIKIQVRHQQEVADAGNMVALLQLGLREGDQIVISAEGDQAQDALMQLKQVITGLSKGEIEAAKKATEALMNVKHGGWKPAAEITPIAGVTASPGFAMGQVYFLESKVLEIPDQPEPLTTASERLSRALEKTQLQLKSIVDDITRRLGPKDAEIFKAQSALLADEELMTLASQRMVAGHGVAWSWHEAVEMKANQLASNANPLIAARAIDLRDIGQRVLANIDSSLKKNSLTDLPAGEFIVVTEDLTPSDTAGLDPNKVKGIATFAGGPTSHTAILARTLGIPAVVAIGDKMGDKLGSTLADLDQKHTLVVDGDAGRVYLDPSEENLASAKAWAAQLAEKRLEAEKGRQLPATTTDDVNIIIGANINRPDQVPLALSEGAECVGLMRTEFLFLERGDTPTEDEQYATYLEMGQKLEGRELIIRTLDIGGDKQVAHLKLPHEENPFLGVRGSRLLLRRLDLMLPQLRALYRAAKEVSNIKIMFPMITSVSEVLTLKQYCEEVRSSLDAPEIPIGIMIEVPAAAVLADKLAEHVAFFSIGTNDLTQYTLATDRQNPVLAAEAKSLHPAVLRLIDLTVKGAQKHQRPVGVCGGLAGDPLGAQILMGLGVSELSMTPRDVAAVKAGIRKKSFADIKALAEKALSFESAEEVEALQGGDE